MRYSKESKSKSTGAVYTPKDMAIYTAEQMIKYKNLDDATEITILDPAVGEGELLVAIIEVIKLCLPCVKIKAVGYETDENVASETKKRLKKIYPDINVEIRAEDFLSAVENNNVDKYDMIIANPPYIRTQIIGSSKSQEIADKLNIGGKIDIYYAFLLYAKNVLKSDGIAGYITSNKFMTIKSGNSVRNYMIENYKLHQITDLGDTKLFTAAVLPCILFFSLGKTEKNEDVTFTSVYEDSKCCNDKNFYESIFQCIEKSGVYTLRNGKSYKFEQGRMLSIEKDSLWTISSEENKKWLEAIEEKKQLIFSDIGKVRVGIKTTADNVFIGDGWNEQNYDLELLKPLITHRNSGQIVPNKKAQWKVLYTHEVKNGKKIAIDITKYPKSETYLFKHYNQLSNRKYVEKAKRNWYEIWVPQNPEAWQRRKIVFKDISERPEFWLDTSGAIVNGDCYWIDINPNLNEDIIYLALAVANSKFIEKYYDIKFNTKLYSGKRRFQSQYVNQFPIPNHETDLAKKAINLVKQIISNDSQTDTIGYKQELDLIVERLFT